MFSSTRRLLKYNYYCLYTYCIVKSFRSWRSLWAGPCRCSVWRTWCTDFTWCTWIWPVPPCMHPSAIRPGVLHSHGSWSPAAPVTVVVSTRRYRVAFYNPLAVWRTARIWSTPSSWPWPTSKWTARCTCTIWSR